MTVDSLPIEDPVRWAAAIHSDRRDRPTRLVWIESPDPRAMPGAPEEVGTAKAVFGLETLLSPAGRGDPWQEWLEMARLLESLGGPGPMLDPATGRWFEREHLSSWSEPKDAESDGADALQLPDEILWSIRATRREGGRGVWLTTEGLARLGLPELEMLEVPEELADVGAALLDGLSGLACVTPPPRDRAWVVGPSLEVSARTLDEVIETIDERSAGSRRHRGGEVPPGAGGLIDALVVCGAQPRGSYRRIWTAPIEVLRALIDGAAVHRSPRAAARQQRLAQRRLDLVDAALVASPDVKVQLAAGDHGSERFWGVVTQSLGSGWSVQPLDLAGRPAAGESERLVARGQVVDWRIELDGAVHGPEDAGPLSNLLGTGPSVAPTGSVE